MGKKFKPGLDFRFKFSLFSNYWLYKDNLSICWAARHFEKAMCTNCYIMGDFNLDAKMSYRSFNIWITQHVSFLIRFHQSAEITFFPIFMRHEAFHPLISDILALFFWCSDPATQIITRSIVSQFLKSLFNLKWTFGLLASSNLKYQ